MNEIKNPENAQEQPLNIADVSRSVFFEIEKYYKRNTSCDKTQYFYCTKIVNFHGSDAFGYQLTTTPGENIFHTGFTAFFSIDTWIEISKEEFVSVSTKYFNALAALLN